MRILTLALFFLFTALCVIVAVANRSIVTFSLDPLPFNWDLPLYLILFIGIFIGLGAGSLVMLWKGLLQARHNRQQNKKIRELEAQIATLSANDRIDHIDSQ